LETVVKKAGQYTGQRLNYVAADRIYATRANFHIKLTIMQKKSR